MHLSIPNDIVSTKIYGKRDDFAFEIVNFPFIGGDAPRSTSYGVYISQLIRFARVSSYVADFNTRNKLLTQKLLIVGRICNNFEKNRAFYDKSMKLGTCLVDNNSKQLRVSATLKMSSNGRHLVFF